MKALVHDGYGNISLQERPMPHIEEAADAIVRVTRSTICTSDLHIMRGAVPRALPDTVLGHEFVGIIEEVGGDVAGLAPGDRVAVNCETFCGTCYFCKHGWVNNCVHGGWELGCRIDGCQAEFVRVPFAASACTPIPDSVSDEDALFLGDILATGWWSAKIAEIEPGGTVAVIGGGPVGIATMMCARLYDPGCIILIERDPARAELANKLRLADRLINGDAPLDTIELAVQALTRHGGADAVIEAAGGSTTFEMAWRIARPNAVVVVSAMYEQDQILPLPRMYGKNLTFKTGGVDASGLDEVMALIEAGKLDTGCLISKRYPLNDILEAYRAFEAHEDDCLKAVITPWEDR
ncbi:alcohol dehydrogenase [uncultured Slackia sp.]|uniref:alcohol dehydrogenase n=1 Tax=uncultured Slackia sp. TaxID=665903 RepID=UPI0025D8F9DB|nr:alcohol dehydrogenase [uncultured Slackia sp.]